MLYPSICGGEMLVEKRTLKFIIIMLSVWCIVSTMTSTYYYIQFETYSREYKHLTSYINTLSGAIGDLANVTSVMVNSSQGIFETVNALSKILESISLKVNILIKYSSDNLVWHNGTAVPLGSTAFDSVFAVADNVNYKYYEGMGMLVTSINGIANNETMGWFWWYWDSSSSKWVFPDFSSDKYILHRNDIVAWTYSDYATWPPKPPT